MLYTVIANGDSISMSPVASPSPSPRPLLISPTSPAYPPMAEDENNAPAPSPSYPPVDISQGIKAAYWPSFNGLDPSSIDTSYFTHIYYAFLPLDPVSFKLNVTPFHQEMIPEFIATLRSRNPPAKVLLSIGGADPNQTYYFSIMSTTNQTRAVFINSTIEVGRKYGFDGLDLDWEFPANDQEMINFALLLEEWQQALVDEAATSGKPHLLLTSAVYYSSMFTTYGVPRSYPVKAMNNFLDWINPMCYDYHGSWQNFTGPNAALFDPYSNLSTTHGVGSWIEAGVPPEKIVMGLPLYGRTWKLKDPNVSGIGAEAVGVGPGDGVLSYSEIVEFNSENKGTVYFDGESVSYYSVVGDSWVGYDDTMSVYWKIRFARSQGLGGYFFWAIGQDNDWTMSRLGIVFKRFIFFIYIFLIFIVLFCDIVFLIMNG